jgi:sortase A
VTPTPQSDIDTAGEAPDVPGFPWWMVTAGGVILGAGTYVWVSGRPPRAVRLQVAQERPASV